MEEKKDPGSANPEESSVGPRVLKQLLRTPAFKDLVVLSLNDTDPKSPRDLAKTLMWEDAALSFGVLGSLPREVNFLIAFLDELGIQLQSMPPDLLREFVSEMVRNLDKDVIKSLPKAYGPLLNTLIWEDPEMRQQMKEGAAETLNALMRMLAGFLNNAATDDKLSGEVILPDPEAMGELINSLFRWMGNAAGKDSEAIQASQEKKIEYFRGVMKATDFGVIRSTVAKRAEANYPVTESVITTLISDPIIFANTLNILPPLLNNLLKGISHALAEIDFPPEILASAVFNLIDDLEAEEIGAIANGFCRFIIDLHEGNLVLGRDEPRFRPVLQNFMERVFYGIDENAAADALLALLEDTEVIISVTADVILGRPELIEKGFPAFIKGINSQLRGFTFLADKLNQLPPYLYRQIGRELEEKADFKETGALINSLARLFNQMLAQNPSLLENTLSSLYRSLDKDEITKLIKEAGRQCASFASGENYFEIVGPDEAGKLVNSLLASYNRSLSENPEKTSESISLFLAQVDQNELSDAIMNTSDHVSQTLTDNPQLARTVIKAFYSIVSGALKGASLKKKNQLLSLFKGKAEKGGGAE